MMSRERWEYQVVEEPNPTALQERLTRVDREGWEALGLGYAGECRLLALVRRQRRREGAPPGSPDMEHSPTSQP
ncbi:MAG: hypothetical protein AB7I23_03050 [Vicinamibacterales bacterium]